MYNLRDINEIKTKNHDMFILGQSVLCKYLNYRIQYLNRQQIYDYLYNNVELQQIASQKPINEYIKAQAYLADYILKTLQYFPKVDTIINIWQIIKAGTRLLESRKGMEVFWN